MRKKILFVVIILLVVNPKFVYAGRGCCSHHGGQNYCGSDGYWYCNDGSRSPTCRCSGGSSSNSNNSFSYQKKEIYGCTDKNAYNYNPSATTNDGSCIQKIYGCTNKEAFNYNEKANVDNHSCIDKVYGCIDISAINYNKQANTKDGSCLYQEKRTEKKKIKYKTKKKYSFFRKEGKVIQKGKNGKKEITYQITRNENKEVVEKKKLSEKILVKPINKIVATKSKKR